MKYIQKVKETGPFASHGRAINALIEADRSNKVLPGPHIEVDRKTTGTQLRPDGGGDSSPKTTITPRWG